MNVLPAPPSIPPVARAVGIHFAALPQVIAIVWAGSATAGRSDVHSDLDFNVYFSAAIPVAERKTIAEALGSEIELDNQFWEPGDEWVDAASGVHCDVMYRSPTWIEDQLDRTLIRYEASVGYSTCFWYNVLTSRILYDPTGWFARLQARAVRPFPEELRRAIVAKNWPILRHSLSSYTHQLELAFARRDRVSVNHRVAALLASYFDILLAVNRQPHPGEKRLLQFTMETCPLLPPELDQRLDEVFAAAAPPEWDWPAFAGQLNELLDGLDDLLRAEGLAERSQDSRPHKPL